MYKFSKEATRDINNYYRTKCHSSISIMYVPVKNGVAECFGNISDDPIFIRINSKRFSSPDQFFYTFVHEIGHSLDTYSTSFSPLSERIAEAISAKTLFKAHWKSMVIPSSYWGNSYFKSKIGTWRQADKISNKILKLHKPLFKILEQAYYDLFL